MSISSRGVTVLTSPWGYRGPTDRGWLGQRQTDQGHVTTDDTYDCQGCAWQMELHERECVCMCWWT